MGLEREYKRPRQKIEPGRLQYIFLKNVNDQSRSRYLQIYILIIQINTLKCLGLLQLNVNMI